MRISFSAYNPLASGSYILAEKIKVMRRQSDKSEVGKEVKALHGMDSGIFTSAKNGSHNAVLCDGFAFFELLLFGFRLLL